ncbi:MAG: DUF2029 domain-containing protein [Candidatus Wallbacteria bacterium]|nr:DUF2029 domain-containing protein [Candidatus Wallbacteria bacterium]
MPPVERPAAAQSAPEIGRAVLLFGLGMALLGVVLYWNRIALGGELGQAPGWVAALAAPVDWVAERTAGPIEGPGPDQRVRVGQLVRGWTVGCAIYFAALAFAVARCAQSKLCLDVAIAWAVILRVVAIASPPILETDPSRYLWDGAVTAAGLNPYRHAPLSVLLYREGRIDAPDRDAEVELDRLGELSLDRRLDPHLRRINHPAVPTCYPPGAQTVFSIAARIAPGDVQVLKAMVAAFDLGVFWVLLALLRAVGRPPIWALAYGWCPLAIKEYAQTGHFDTVACFFLLASLYSLMQHRRLLAGVFAGVAIATKLFPAVFVATAWRRYGARGLAAAALAAVLLALPFAGAGASAFVGIKTYGMTWVGNASLFELARAALGGLGDAAPTAAKIALGAAGLAGCLWLSRRPESTPAELALKCLSAEGLLFVLSPVQNPWYCGWMVPLAALSGRVSWLVLSGTMVTYYAYFSTGGYLRSVPGAGFELDLRWIEYVPFFALLALELAGQRGPASSRIDSGKPA